MTRQFEVVRTFKAANVISGAEREFQPGETFLCDTAQRGAELAIEFEKSFFMVDPSVLDRYCKHKNEGGPFF